jgi:2-polyprenyl-6-methoxyphenol hydroxylase-like FAD-dependent oxidoreductase
VVVLPFLRLPVTFQVPLGGRAGHWQPDSINTMQPVLVAGGGIGGLTFAHACLKARIPVVVLEASPVLKPRGSGIGLWGPALMALRALGLEAPLEAEGKAMAYAGYRTADGKWVAKAAPHPGV